MKPLMNLVWTLAKLLLGLLCVTGLAAAIYCVYENHAGQRELQAYLAQLKNEGFRFGPEIIRPKPMPDDENFAKTPLLSPLFDTVIDPKTGYTKLRDQSKAKTGPSQEVISQLTAATQKGLWQKGELPKLDESAIRKALFTLDHCSAEMDEIATAAERPFAAYPVRDDAGFGLGLHHLIPLMHFVSAFSGRASGRLALQLPEDALKDVHSCLEIDKHLSTPQLLIESLVYSAEAYASLRPIWDGLRSHAWRLAQLDEIERDLSAIKPAEQYVASIKGEMAIIPDAFARASKIPLASKNQGNALHEVTDAEKVLNAIPLSGWSDFNELLLLRWHRRSLDELNAKEVVFFPKQHAENLDYATSLPWNPETYLAKISLNVVPTILQRVARVEQQLQFVHVAFALERYWLVNQKYPRDLSELESKDLVSPAHDVCSGKPVRYRAEGGGYRIWADGWNQQDDGGKLALNSSGGINYDAGDWAWIMPGSAAVK